MKSIQSISMMFVAVCIAIAAGYFISLTSFEPEEKALFAYACACVVTYVFYCISGEAKREEIEHWDECETQYYENFSKSNDRILSLLKDDQGDLQ